jgi:hypothetical protein
MSVHTTPTTGTIITDADGGAGDVAEDLTEFTFITLTRTRLTPSATIVKVIVALAIVEAIAILFVTTTVDDALLACPRITATAKPDGLVAPAVAISMSVVTEMVDASRTVKIPLVVFTALVILAIIGAPTDSTAQTSMNAAATTEAATSIARTLLVATIATVILVINYLEVIRVQVGCQHYITD